MNDQEQNRTLDQSKSLDRDQIIRSTLENLGEETFEQTLKREMTNCIASGSELGSMSGLGVNTSPGSSPEPCSKSWPQSWISEYDSILEELTGFGPIKSLLNDPGVSEVLINGHQFIFFEKEGKLQRQSIAFSSALTLDRLVKRILLQIERTADRRFPLVDGTLGDGTRVHIALPPVTKQTTVSFRKHLHSRWSLDDLVLHGMLTKELASKLKERFANRANILICGPTGAGKTTLLRALLTSLPEEERTITVEDTDEIGLSPDRGVALLTRMVPDDLAPTITLNDLLKNALRMRPDRIVVGEIRGEEALIFLDALATGHGGSLSSIHAGSTMQALSRLESLVSRAAPQWSPSIVRQLIYEGIDTVIYLGKKDGCRRVLGISDLAGIESFGFLLSHWALP